MSEHISGIDWSGDPGDPRKSSLPPILVIAMAHIAADNAPWLRTLVDGVRRRHGLPESFVFKHSDCSRRLRLDFFAAIDPVPLFVTVNMVDKRVWYAGKATEEPRTLLYRAIADLVCACPKVYVLGQAIYVDQPKSETAAVRDRTTVVRRSVRAAN